MCYIRDLLRLKRINDAAAVESLEDILHSGIVLLLSDRIECSDADEAVAEAMRQAAQSAARDLTLRRCGEVSESLCLDDFGDSAREVSRYDFGGGVPSAEDVLIQREDDCSLDVAIERAEYARYTCGFDALLAVLVRAGVEKGLWQQENADGLLSAFGCAVARQRYSGDTSIHRVIVYATRATERELVAAMRLHLPWCGLIFTALGYAA
jgi:hypothetical protein